MKIYIMAHKDCTLPRLPSIYEPIQVGVATNGRLSNDWLSDNTGENISQKNGSYNELTGLYWMWKNSEESIIGLCHYRRYFVKTKGKLKNLVLGKTEEFLQEKDIISMLERCDLIVHNKSFFKQGCMQQYLDTQKYPEDIHVVKEVIEELYPEYTSAFRSVMEGKVCHLLNMLIGKKTLIDQYCEWLFSILKETEKRLRLEESKDQFNRRIGMLGERLLDVWIQHNNLKIKEVFTVNTERIDKTPW